MSGLQSSSSGGVPPSICGGTLSNRRGLLAALWSVVVTLTFISFIVALIFTLSATNTNNEDEYDYNNNNNNEHEREEDRNQQKEYEMAVTSRAMAFCALWTAVVACLMAIFGTVILGFQSPLSGIYYTCCSIHVHRTTPLALGSFIGALLMFANLTLVCSVLFGEFDIRDYQEGGGGGAEDKDAAQYEDTAVRRSSMAFSIMCMFLTVLYAGFAGLSFAFSKSVLEELNNDERDEILLRNNTKSTNLLSSHHHPFGGHNSIGTNTGHPHYHTTVDGYIGERFDVVPSRRPPVVSNGGGFASNAPDNGII